ncbi:MAG: hypothetical protein LBT05_01065 [Planctomycetaceae bacterium]|jgi:hypothetical protein|nr:hypothetical protein [Planctomycetaceae bacterium]
MFEKKQDDIDAIHFGFSPQQIVLIIAAFLIGFASAITFKVVLERGFGPTHAVASQNSQAERR